MKTYVHSQVFFRSILQIVLDVRRPLSIYFECRYLYFSISGTNHPKVVRKAPDNVISMVLENWFKPLDNTFGNPLA